MKKKLSLFVTSFETRNTVLFLLACTLIALPLIAKHLHDTEQLLLDNLSTQLALVAAQGKTEFSAAEIEKLSTTFTPNSPSYKKAVQVLASLETRYAIANAALLKRLPSQRFVYLADGKANFGLNQAVSSHVSFPKTEQVANAAWQAQKRSTVHLFESGENRWFQVYNPIKYGHKVVGMLMITQFTTAIDSNIAHRKLRYLLASLVATMILGTLFWALMRSQKRRRVHVETIPTPQVTPAYQNVLTKNEVGVTPLRIALEHERTNLLQEAKMFGKTLHVSIQEHGSVWISNRAVALVQSVLHPLFENALHHGVSTAKLGKVSIDIYPREQGALVCIGDNGDGVDFKRIRAVALQQNLLGSEAEGIPQRLLELLFDPGIHPNDTRDQNLESMPHYMSGLASVKKKLEDIGGKLKLVNTARVGTMAQVFLPRQVLSNAD